MFLRIRHLSLLFLMLGTVVTAADPHPYVAGFHRFTNDLRDEAGILMIGELGCAACHDLGAANDQIFTKAAPDLSEVAFRCDPKFIAGYVADPQKWHVGTTMPSLLDGDKQKATAITHYLVARSKHRFLRESPDSVAVDRGRELYNSVGCVACHVANPSEKDEQTFDGAVRTFPKLSAKYSVQGLRSFLRDPLHVRSSGRMPSLRLQDREAADIANYLLRETRVDGPVAFEEWTGQRRDLNDRGQLKPFRTGIANGIQLPQGMPRYQFTTRFSGELQIDTPGEYSFHWQSSGAIRWTIAERTIVDRPSAPNRNQVHDGSKKVQLDAGWYSFSLEFFEPRDKRTLQIQWKGPGIQLTEIPSASLRHQSPSDSPTQPTSDWRLDSELAKQGKALFVNEGCANCHDQGIDRNTLKQKTGITQRDVNIGGGCLNRDHIKKTPNYGLSRSQRQAMRAALHQAQYNTLKAPSPHTLITRNLTRLNCYACHKRGRRGGITEIREPHFTCGEKDLGAEGRFPPTLTLVGGKLQLDWLASVVENGASVRPYMNTRMPGFGSANVRDLAKRIVNVDLSPNRAMPPLSDPPDAAKKIGRELAGKGKLQCVSCHKFNGHDSVGIQAIDLTTTTQRLNREWFHEYMLNPAVLRPGTRMPQLWPDGESFYKDILGGDATRQIDSIWTYLSDGELAINPEGLAP